MTSSPHLQHISILPAQFLPLRKQETSNCLRQIFRIRTTKYFKFSHVRDIHLIRLEDFSWGEGVIENEIKWSLATKFSNNPGASSGHMGLNILFPFLLQTML